MKKYELKDTTINAIMEFLGNCPYAQVANLITAIQQEVTPQATANPEPPKKVEANKSK